MKVLAQRGRRSEAIRQYQTCVGALERELGVEPEAATIAMYEEIRKGDYAEECGKSVETGLAESSESSPVIAVLPVENLSGEDDLYFADGITEDLTTALSRFHDLQVIARGSSFVYRGNDVPENEAAAALGADFLVRGSVRRSNSAVRINVQLQDIANERTIWGEQYNRQLEDVFEIQNDIVSTLVATLVGRVETARLKQARFVPVERLEAYDIMLRGKYHHHLFTAEDCQACIDFFELAIQREPNYAIAHAWLACGYGQAMVHDLGGIAELVDKAQAAAERGLELDEDESECHRVLAQVYLTRGNLRRALWHQERALFLNPNDDRSICAMGELLTFAGKAAEGEMWVRKSLKLNPYHPQRYWSHLARALVHLERHGEALDILDRIGRPRSDDLVFAIVASTKLGEKHLTQKALGALRTAMPGFDAEAFAKTLPYERAEDSKLILDALRSVL
jgi:adenylate cyclase